MDGKLELSTEKHNYVQIYGICGHKINGKENIIILEDYTTTNLMNPTLKIEVKLIWSKC